MAAMASTDSARSSTLSDGALKTAAALWFAVALLGQWAFAYYIAHFYGGTALRGDWDAWTRRLINGFIEGDLAGNIAVLLHIALAFVITFLGPLQFVPQVRRHAPGFHRWNGRVYITTAFVISLGAIYMTVARGAGSFNSSAVQLNAVFIVVCAAMTLRFALARRIDVHHRWALRTFVVVSGVWFLRVGYGLLVMIFQGPIPGTSDTLTGPTDVALAYSSYLLPLLILELYFLAKRASPPARLAMSGALLVATGAMGVGIFGAAMIFWIPNLS